MIIKCGLSFVSTNIFPIYFPNIPIERSCNPPIAKIITARDGHPGVGLPQTTVLITIYSPQINAKKNVINPRKLAISRGVSEKEINPSNE